MKNNRLSSRILFIGILTLSFVVSIAFFSKFQHLTYADYYSYCYDECTAEGGDGAACEAACDTTNSFEGCVYDMYDIILDDEAYDMYYDFCVENGVDGDADCALDCVGEGAGYGDGECLDYCLEATDSDCESVWNDYNSPPSYDDEGFSFCANLPAGADNIDPTITLDQDFYLRTATGSISITGDVTDNVDVAEVNLYSVDSDSTTPCDLSGVYPDQTFSCDTESLSTDQSYKFEIFAEDSEVNEAVEDVLVELDVDNDKDLISLWRFDDDTDWLKDDISSLSATSHSAIPSSDGYTTDSLDSSFGGYMTVDDSAEVLSFDSTSSHFRVEAMIKKPTITGNDVRVAGKYNQANNENSWLIGIDSSRHVYCAVWIDGFQQSIHSTASLVDAQWNNVGCEWDASTGELTAYVEGVESGSTTISGGPALASSTNDFAIGARATGGDGFGGLIDNVKIYDYEFNDTEDPTITLDQDFYLRTATGSVTIEGDVTDNVDVDEVNLYSVDSDSTTPCTLSGVYPDQTFSCDTESLSTDQSYKFEVKATDTATNEAVEDVLVELDVDNDKDLVALWRFDDDTDWLKEDISSLSGTDHSAIQSSDGYTTDSLDSSPGYMTVEDSAGVLSFDQEDSSFMVEAMIKDDDYSANHTRIAGKNNEENIENSWLLGTNSSAKVYCAVWINGKEKSLYSTASLSVDQWHSVGCKWSAGDRYLRIYIDGSEDSSLDLSGTEAEIASSTSDFAIGARATGEYGFGGLIDNVKIYSYEIGDGKAPKITFDPIDDPSAITDRTPTISGSISDSDLCEFAEYLVLDTAFLGGEDDIDNYDWKEFFPTDGVWNSVDEDFSITLDAFDVEGGYHIYIRARDVYQNFSFYHHNGWIINYSIDSDHIMANRLFTLEFVDNSAPTISLNKVQPNPSMDKDIDIRGYVEDYVYDTRSAIDSVEYSLDGGDWEDVTILTSSGDGLEKEFLVDLSSLSVAEHTVRVRASDESSNETGNDYDVCFDDCMTGGLQDEDMCNCSCDSHKKKSIQSVTFEIVEEDVPESELDDYSISVGDGSSVDDANTSAIVGNLKARLPLEYDFDLDLQLYTNEDEFGALYGEKVVGVHPSIDGNLWLTFNDGKFGYYNILEDTLVRYPKIWEDLVKINGLTEFEYGGNRFLALELQNGYPLTIYSIEDTINDTSDDSYTNYSALLGVNSDLEGVQIDNRGAYPCIYAIIADNSIYGAATAEIMWIDTQGTIDNLADDTTTTWAVGDGIGSNHVSLLFDEVRNRFVAGDYNSGKVSYCDDMGTPSNKSDDVCDMSPDTYLSDPIVDILVDGNGWYWFAGDNGVSTTYVEDIATLASTGYYPYFSNAELGSQRAYRIAWVDNIEKGTEELLISTREGSIFAFDYNGTYDEPLDDRVTSYTFPGELYGSYVSFDMMFDSQGSTAWMMMPGAGLYGLDITRSFESQSEVILWPEVQAGEVQVDHFTLESITGEFVGSIDTFVSNDNGANWYPVAVGGTVDFPTSDSQMRIKLVLNKTGEDTPTVLGISVSYATYGEDQFTTSSLNIEYPRVASIGGDFDTEVTLLDDLGLTPNWDGEVVISAHRAIGGGDASYCFEFDVPSEIVSGESVIGSKALCSGTYYIRAFTDDGRSVRGSNIVVSGGSARNPYISPLCGNGVLDEGEECDPNVEGDLPMCMEMDGKYVSGTMSCSNFCEYEYTECEEEEVDIIAPLVELVTEVSDDDKVSLSVGKILSLATKIVAVSFFLTSLGTVPYYVLRSLIGILNFFGMSKRTTEYGFVYNTLTKEPVDRAIIRVMDSNGKVVETMISGRYGEFYSDLDPGNYTLSVRKPGFDFPSSVITTSTDRNISNVYTGSLSIGSDDVEPVVAIPIDPLDSSFLKRFVVGLLSRGSVWVMLLKLCVFVGLFVYSIVIYTHDSSVINLIILIIYGILSFFLVINSFERRVRYGVVMDKYGNILKGVSVVLKKKEFGEVVGERITDEKGRYRFVVEPGEYSLSVVTKGKSIDAGKVEMSKKSPMIVNMDVVLS